MEGESMSEWKLLDLCIGKGKYGIAAPAVPRNNNLPTYLRITDINDDGTVNKGSLCSVEDENSKNYILKENDIVFARTGNSTGRSYFYNKNDGELVYAGFLIKFSLNPNIVNPVILKYYTHSKPYYDWIHSFDTGATRGNINAQTYANMPVVLPEKNVQDIIVHILSSLDAKIETNNKLNEKLEEMAQAIFKSWFVDFEPFKDKPFHETELGMIPEGWEVKRLCDIVDNIGGYSYKGNELKESTTAMCTIKNFERNGGFKIDGYKEIIPSDKLKASQELSLFDVVVAHTDLTQNAEVIGNPAIILSKSKYDRIIFSMDLTKVISKNMNVSKSLLYCILRNKRFKNHALGYVNGTTVLHMSKKAVPDYMLAFPKDSVILASLSKCFDSIFGRMHEIYEENDRLTSLRDTLLPRLMSGELIV